MAFGGGSSRDVRSEINITPLVDVVLVLLIIFMVATPILQMGLDVEVPPKLEVSSAAEAEAKEQVVVIVRSDGFQLGERMIKATQELRDAIAKEMTSRPEAERVVFINSQDDLTFDRAVAAMDAAHDAGAVKVGFLTDAPSVDRN